MLSVINHKSLYLFDTFNASVCLWSRRHLICFQIFIYSTLFICACAVPISLASSCQIVAWRTVAAALCCICRFACCRPYFVAYIVGRRKMLQVVTFHFIIICVIRCIWSARIFILIFFKFIFLVATVRGAFSLYSSQLIRYASHYITR